MNPKIVLNKIKTALNMEVKLEAAKLDNGTMVEAEVFEAGAEIFIVTAEDRVALPVGEYVFEDGKILVVAEEGIIGEIKEAAAEEEMPVEEAPELEAAPTTPKKVVESVSKEMFFSDDQKAEIMLWLKEAVKAEVDALNLSKEIPKAVELEEVKPIKASPEAMVDKKELHLYGQNQAKSIQARVYERIANYKINKN